MPARHAPAAYLHMIAYLLDRRVPQPSNRGKVLYAFELTATCAILDDFFDASDRPGQLDLPQGASIC
jgi:hypothetical protein